MEKLDLNRALVSLVVKFQGKEGGKGKEGRRCFNGPGKLQFTSSQVKFISLCVLSCKYSYQEKAVGGDNQSSTSWERTA